MVLRGNTRTRFSVQAEFEPNTLSRVLELFAIRGLMFDTMTARKTQDGLQWIELDCCDVEDQQAGVLLNKLKQIITVRTARFETTLLVAA